jgi:uncharacterized membrane protein
MSQSDVPVQVIIAAFKDEKAASAALDDLKSAKRLGLINIVDAAVLTKDAKGKVKIKETADMGGGKGFTIGAVIGGLISLIAGPIGWMALAGGLLGGMAAKMSDGGFSDKRLRRVAEGLTPNSSAIIAVVQHTWVREVKRILAAEATDMVTESLSKDITEQLQAGNQVAYTVASTGDAIMAARIVGNEKATKAEQDTSNEEGMTIVVADAEVVQSEAQKPTGETATE